MKLKLDENLGHECRGVLERAGHDVASVFDEGLAAAGDDRVIAAAAAEDRCLVTLDLEFGNPLLYDPARYSGIAVLRVPAKASRRALVEAADTLTKGLAENRVDGRLWIVEQNRIRIYQPEVDQDPSG